MKVKMVFILVVCIFLFSISIHDNKNSDRDIKRIYIGMFPWVEITYKSEFVDLKKYDKNNSLTEDYIPDRVVRTEYGAEYSFNIQLVQPLIMLTLLLLWKVFKRIRMNNLTGV